MKLEQLANRGVVVINPDDTLNTAISRMWRAECRHLPVVRENVPIGMVSERDVLFHVCWCTRELPGCTRVEKVMASPVKVLSPQYSVQAAAQMMLSERLSAVPLTVGDTLYGIVTEIEFLKCFCDERSALPGGKYRQANVVDYMSLCVYSLSPDDATLDAVSLMREQNVRHVPVVSESTLVGILSDRDVLRGCPRDEGKRPISVNELRLDQASTVRGIMSQRVQVLDESASLADAARVMVAHKIGGLPIIRHGDLVGIITETDLLLAFCRAGD